MQVFKYIFWIAMVTFLGCKEDPITPDTFGELFGQIVEEGSNEPIEDVSITSNPPTTSLLTDVDGRFTLSSVKSGNYSLRIEKDGYLTRLESVAIFADQATNILIKLRPDSLQNTSPDIPTLIFPLSDSEVETSETFVWSGMDKDEDDLIYELLIFNADQSETILSVNELEDTLYLVEDLPFGRNLFWQIIADDGTDKTFSEVIPFRTQEIPDFRYLWVEEVDGKLQIFTGIPDVISTKLTDCPKNAWRPRLSPLRDLVAFIADDGIENQIFLMDRNGDNQRKLTTLPIAGNNNFDLDFSWSPDGSKIAYMNNNKLYSINRDGSGLTQIATAPVGWTFSECDWNLQGDRLLVRIVGLAPHNNQLYVLDLIGNFLELVEADVPGTTSGGSWSLDGNNVLFAQDVSGFESFDGRQLDSHIFIKNLSSQSIKDLSEDKFAGTNDIDPRYSPDGAFVIFTNQNNDGISSPAIFTSDLNGDGRSLLIDNAQMPDWE